jgi:ribosome modulation factor
MSAEKNPTREGADAFMSGMKLSECPYPPDSDEAVEWEGGWMECEEEELAGE